MTEDRFEEFLRQAAQDYNTPPATPRQEMWQHIEQARRFQRRRPHTLPRWTTWVMGVAAVLIVGILIGRFSALVHESVPLARTEQPAAKPAAPESDLPYRMAAIQHLSRAEALITSYRAEADADAALQEWAADLLSSTRLLLDSPAGADPKMAALLQDLELVLVQMAQIAPRAPGNDRRLIDEALEHNNVLPRLRAAVPAGPVRAST